MLIWATPEQTTLSGQFVKIKSIRVADLFVIDPSRLRNESSPLGFSSVLPLINNEFRHKIFEVTLTICCDQNS